MHGEQVVLCLTRNDFKLLRQLASSPLPMAHPADPDTLALLENQGLCARTVFPAEGWTITAAGKLLAGMEQRDAPALLPCIRRSKEGALAQAYCAKPGWCAWRVPARFCKESGAA